LILVQPVCVGHFDLESFLQRNRFNFVDQELPDLAWVLDKFALWLNAFFGPHDLGNLPQVQSLNQVHEV
jgi:hypothetical protein